MRKALAIIAALAGAVLLMAARPVSELQLMTQLNGQPIRWTLADGGPSGLFSQFDAGSLNSVACVPLVGTLNGQAFTPNVIELLPEVPMNVCIRPMVGLNGVALPWDGGCSGATTGVNGGVAIQPWAPWFVVPHVNATHICAASDAGYVRGALFQLQ